MKPVLLMLQITQARKERDAKERGLLLANSFKLPPDTEKYYVVITPEHVFPSSKVRAEFIKRGLSASEAGTEAEDEEMSASEVEEVEDVGG